jgi:nucleoid-associated protein YgaU
MAKLSFQKLDHAKNTIGDPIEVSYNPKELTFGQTANYADINIPGLDAPILQFVRGSAETLALELFFDSTDNGTGVDSESVTELVDSFYQLVKISGNLHTPPIVRVLWGTDLPGLRNDQSVRPIPAFDCIVVTCNRKYTLFNPNGVPLRAVVNLALREYRSVEEQLEALNLQSSDHTRLHTVQAGENLPLIAYQAYGKASYWRVIADANNISNTRALTSGAVLSLPPIV